MARPRIPTANAWFRPWSAEPAGPSASQRRRRSGPASSRSVREQDRSSHGGATRLAAAIPEAQSSPFTSVTAAGPLTPPVEGNTASATPAASAIGSMPATRVVFLVAKAGNPRSSTVCGCCSWTTTRGAGARGDLIAVPAQGVDEEVGADSEPAKRHQGHPGDRQVSSPVHPHGREHTCGTRSPIPSSHAARQARAALKRRLRRPRR